MWNFEFKPESKLGFSFYSGCMASTDTKTKPRCDKWVGGFGGKFWMKLMRLST